MDLSADDHLTRSVAELGEPDSLYQVSRGRFVAKLSVGLLLLLLGVIGNYLWWVHGPGKLDALVAHLLILLPLLGIALLWHMYTHRRLFVLVYPTGLLRLRRGEVDSFPWWDIQQIRLKVQRAAAPELTRSPDGSLTSCWIPVDVPTFQLWNAGLTVVRGDGVEAHFGPALTEYAQLAEEVQQRTFHVQWPRLWAQFLADLPVSFGTLEFTRSGLRHAGKFLRWADLKELTIAQGKLSIKQTGKWLPWALLDISTLPNPHLVFALATEAQRLLRPELSKQPKSVAGD
jgi:energy-converting hydrogenase Eha subunit E